MVDVAHERTMPSGSGKRTVAVMQPYFFPYAGYYRLMAAADVFIVFDCVQFPRRGRIHRSQIGGKGTTAQWLTLPLAHQPRDTLIRDVRLAEGGAVEFERRLDSLGWINAAGEGTAGLIGHLYHPGPLIADFVTDGLSLVRDLLGLDVEILRSSRFGVDPELRGQDRVIALAKCAGAMRYVNAPGGRTLYDAFSFERAGLSLNFLAPYTGRFPCMLQALLQQDHALIRDDILATSTVEPVLPG